MFSVRDPNPIISNVNSDRILAGWRCFLVRSLIWAIETYWWLRRIEARCHDSHEFHPVIDAVDVTHILYICSAKQARSKPFEARLTEIHLRNQILQMCHGFIGVITLARQTERVRRHVYNIPRMWAFEKSFNHFQCGFNMFNMLTCFNWSSKELWTFWYCSFLISSSSAASQLAESQSGFPSDDEYGEWRIGKAKDCKKLQKYVCKNAHHW